MIVVGTCDCGLVQINVCCRIHIADLVDLCMSREKGIGLSFPVTAANSDPSFFVHLWN